MTLHRTVHLGRFAIGEREVTNAEYAEFVRVTGYRPVRTERWPWAQDRLPGPAG